MTPDITYSHWQDLSGGRPAMNAPLFVAQPRLTGNRKTRRGKTAAARQKPRSSRRRS